jgi:hypothetical protein
MLQSPHEASAAGRKKECGPLLSILRSISNQGQIFRHNVIISLREMHSSC